jgi:hypothetical protein
MIIRRERAAAPCLRWCGLLFVLTAFWPAQIHPYLRAIPVDPRYYEPLLLPSAVAIGLAASWLRGWKLAATVAAAVPLVLICNAVASHNARIRGAVAVETYEQMKSSLPVVADPGLAATYRFLDGFGRRPIASEPRPEWREWLLVLRYSDADVTGRAEREAWNRRTEEGMALLTCFEVFAWHEPRSTKLGYVIRLRQPPRGDLQARVYHCVRR